MFNHLLAMTSFLVQSGRGFLHVVTWNKPRLAHCGCYIVPVPGNGHDDEDDDLSNTNVTFIEPVPDMTVLFFLFRPQCSPPESAFIVLTALSFPIQQGQIDYISTRFHSMPLSSPPQKSTNELCIPHNILPGWQL